MRTEPEEKCVRLSAMVNDFANSTLAKLSDEASAGKYLDQALGELDTLICVSEFCMGNFVHEQKAALRKNAGYHQNAIMALERTNDTLQKQQAQLHFTKELLADFVLSKQDYPLLAQKVTESKFRTATFGSLALNYNSDYMKELRDEVTEEIQLRLLQQSSELRDVKIGIVDGTLSMNVGLIDVTLSLDYVIDMTFNVEHYYWLLKKFVYRRMELFSAESEHKRTAIDYFARLVLNLNELFKNNTPEQKQRIESRYLSFLSHTAKQLQIFIILFNTVRELCGKSWTLSEEYALEGTFNGFTIKMSLPKAFEIFNDIVSTKFIDLVSDNVTVRLKISEDYQCIVDDQTVYQIKSVTFTNSFRREQRRYVQLNSKNFKTKLEEAQQLTRIINHITQINGYFQQEGGASNYELIIKLNSSFGFYSSPSVKKFIYELQPINGRVYAVVYRWGQDQLLTLIDPVRLESSIFGNVLKVPQNFGLVRTRALIRQIIAHNCIKQAFFKAKSDPIPPKARFSRCVFENVAKPQLRIFFTHPILIRNDERLVLTLFDGIDAFNQVKFERVSRTEAKQYPLLKWFEVEQTTPVNIRLLAKWLIKVMVHLHDLEESQKRRIKIKIFSDPNKSNQTQPRLS